MEEFREAWRQVLEFGWAHPGWTIFLLALMLVIAWRSGRPDLHKAAAAPKQRGQWPKHNFQGPLPNWLDYDFDYDEAPDEAPDEATERLRKATEADFRCRSLIAYQTEWALYRSLINTMRSTKIGRKIEKTHYIIPQASLGAFLETENKEDYRNIASLRPDFVITDSAFVPQIAIEYHGSGHYRRGFERTELHDDLKKIALDKAGIDLLVADEHDDFGSFSCKIVERLGYLAGYLSDPAQIGEIDATLEDTKNEASTPRN